MVDETCDKFNDTKIIISRKMSPIQLIKKLKFFNNGIMKIRSLERGHSLTKEHDVTNSIASGFLLLVLLIGISGLLTIIMWFTEFYMFLILQFETLTQGSSSYRTWISPPVKPLISVYPFNYTNINNVLEFNHTPIVEELGPFVYRETLERVNAEFNKNGTITYQEKRSSVFVPEMSDGDPENLNITVPNILLISANKFSKFLPKPITSMILDLFQVKGFIDLKINDYLWGYEDIMYTMAQVMASTVNKDAHLSKFGIMSSRRGVSPNRITINSGVGNLNELGIITNFNGRKTLDIWKTDECNRLDGSDGSQFPPTTVNRKSKLYVFHPILCRRFPLVYKEDIEIMSGVTAFRFQAPSNVLDKTDNVCYCTSKECPPSGIINSSPCHDTHPIMMSFPHFYQGDPELRKNILGLSPNPKLHETFVDVHSRLGVSLGGRSRFQINVMLNKTDGVSHFRNFKQGLILPVAWIEMKVDKLPEDIQRKLQLVSISIYLGEMLLKWISLLMLILCIMYLIRKIMLKDGFMLRKKHSLPS